MSLLVAGLVAAVIVQSLIILGMQRKSDSPSERPRSKPDLLTRGTGRMIPPPAPLPPLNPPGKGGDLDVFERNLADWDPFKEMHSMQERINQMFGTAFDRFHRSDDFNRLFHEYTFAPDINMEDKGDRFVVTVNLPGTSDARFDVKVEGRTLTISGTTQSESREESKGKMLKQEIWSGKFWRSVTLPDPVKADKMTTENKKGILRIEIPKEIPRTQ